MTTPLITDAEVAQFRAEAEARMTDTWEIGEDGGYAYNPATGKDEQTLLSPFTTPGRLKMAGNVVRDGQAGDRTVVETRRELHIPVDAPATPPNAVARCTAIGPTTDPTVLNTVVRISANTPGSQTTARRLEVVEVLT